MPETDERFDAIIIGAGISGLVCGCYLAKSGLKVLLLEHHDKPGGYFTSFKRKGFLFDAAAHSFGNYREGGHVRKIFSELGVDKLVTIERHDPSDIVITPDFSFAIHNDIQMTATELSIRFPAEKANINAFLKYLTTADSSAFTALRTKTFDSLLHDFFHDQKLISALSYPVFGSGGLPPSRMQAFIGAKIFSEFIIDGGYYPEGGIQKLPDAMARIIEQNGGKILYRNQVEKILCSDAQAVGVKAGGRSFAAKYVVSACDISQTFRDLLDESEMSRSASRHLEQLVPSLSTFILYLGIDGAFEGLPRRGSNIWYLPLYDHDKIYNNMQSCSFDQVGFLLRASPNENTILSFFNAPFQSNSYWKENKLQIMEEFVGRIETYIPGLRKHILFAEAASPSTLFRYTLNSAGAAFGWAKLPSQVFDPIFTKNTFIDRLYLTGHWTGIAFGMPGTCYSGRETARRILRREHGSAAFITSGFP